MRLDWGRLSDADAVLVPALETWPDDMALHNLRFLSLFVRGDTDAAGRVALEVLDRGDVNDSEAWFVAALGQILSQQGPWEVTGREFLAKDHKYRDYIAMLYYAYAGDGASEVLERRWAEIAPGRRPWEKRLRQGDAMVWREMLIGYYVDEVTAEEIFGSLEDEDRFQSSALAEIDIPRRGLSLRGLFLRCAPGESAG